LPDAEKSTMANLFVYPIITKFALNTVHVPLRDVLALQGTKAIVRFARRTI
jgi:hypothetical protein